jgi:glycosidase
MSINTDYVRVNAEAEVKDPNSTYHFWAAVLGLRKKYLDIFVYGDYKAVDSASEEVYAYTRQCNGSGRTSVSHSSNLLNKIETRVKSSEGQKALVVCNWTEKDLEWDAAGNGFAEVKEVLLDNYGSAKEAAQRISGDQWSLKPYEAVVVLV